MSDEISLLPENLRKKEQEIKKVENAAPKPASELKFSTPTEEGEDIEVIEVDEGEIEQVLANEPLLSRVAYRVSNFLDELKTKIFQPSIPPPPPKLPPQFFAPPPAKPASVSAPSLPSTTARPVPQVGTSGAVAPSTPTVGAPAGAARPTALPKPKVQITPSAIAPRRVRVIKRVRKPVRVSFVSEEELKLFHIDIPKRRFTFITAVVFFSVLIGGGYALLSSQLQAAQAGYQSAKAQTAQVEQQITSKQETWSSFQNLEPRLKALGALLDAHVSPTRLLELIEHQTLPTVSYDTFSLTPEGKVSLTVTADSLDSAAAQVAAFQQASFVKKVEASTYSLNYRVGSDTPETVAFQIILTLSDQAMRAPALAISP